MAKCKKISTLFVVNLINLEISLITSMTWVIVVIWLLVKKKKKNIVFAKRRTEKSKESPKSNVLEVVLVRSSSKFFKGS